MVYLLMDYAVKILLKNYLNKKMHNDCAKSPLKTGKCTKKSDYCAKLRPIER